MKKLIAPLALIATIAAIQPALTQSPAALPGQKDPTRISGGTYAIDPRHSQMAFAYDHFGFTTNMGLLAAGSGTLTLDPKAPATASVVVEVPIDSLRTGVASFEEELRSPKFFDAARFPTARFESTAVKATGDTAEISGHLTIRGVTKMVTLQASFAGAGTNFINKKDTIGFNASTTIRRSDFGLGYGVPMIGDRVEIKITAAFEKR